MKTRLFLLLALLTQAPAQAAPFTISSDGQEVTDKATGLIWRRCAEGMVWNGATCAGIASTFIHEQALLRAKNEATASSRAWRLPNVKELSSLVVRSRSEPAIDTSAFPATPTSIWFWSSSPLAGDSDLAWGVLFDYGVVAVSYRDDGGAVRLVRASQ